ncbi:type VI secretion system-associated protein TagF [Affinibrenneria salicis]|uniref:Type VI secretion system-associated protein TagF n=1 Tax=Affinibrenneria salicis TaxID=2590031 RepID=A0A5J5FW97_9GAMM|nr:type VI secretion system-associated protein TagF [Affinibrenneria salicis]KAA8998157.1 type VI secretion system-associated protein TagF [Affinibrenneria salicis]
MSLFDTLGWYGKLPSTGDFLQRRLPDALVHHWAHWFHMGLVNWQKAESQDDPQRQFRKAPVWNFVIPATLGNQFVQMGCLLPASDRVGRQYPICALRLFSPESWNNQQLAVAGEWYQSVGKTLFNGVRNGYSAEQLDRALLALPPLPPPGDGIHTDILDVIGYKDVCTLNWQQAADCFSPLQYASFWWTNQTDGYPLYTHVHSGNFTAQLFATLFNPTDVGQSGRGGLYPRMFD